ncbi:MAG: zinc-ribbon domain-containing protein, partial [Candidatus Fimenecus sp.]
MYCPKCGTNNSPQASVCQVCGTPLPKATGDVKQMPMPNGNRLRFANSDAYQAPPSRSNGASTMPAPKKSRKKPLLIALGSVGGVVVLCAVLLVAFLPQLERAMLGEIGYYLYRETDTVQTILSSEYIEAFL